jgi:PDDEXK-like domain of unknown function (DUF3799)
VTTQIIPDLPDDTYHADRNTLSFSGAKLLLPPSCPAKFRERMDNPPKPKPQYTFGHAAHRLVLGKGAEIVEVDAPDWKTKAAQEIRNTACNGIAPMLTHELETARAMERAVREHPTAGPLFEQGDAEMSLYATDATSGVELRGRTDWYTTIDGQFWVVDFKTSTTAEPEEFARMGAKWLYHGQHAWYEDLVKAVGLSDSPRFVDVVCEKTPPYVVSVVEYDAEAVAEGRRLNRKAIEIYAECIRTDTWPDYGPGIHSISLPMWAFDDEMEISI